MPFGAAGEFPLCQVCWEREILWRKVYNIGLPLDPQLSRPEWDNAESIAKPALWHIDLPKRPGTTEALRAPT